MAKSKSDCIEKNKKIVEKINSENDNIIEKSINKQVKVKCKSKI